jgi:hypothetical protein
MLESAQAKSKTPTSVLYFITHCTTSQDQLLDRTEHTAQPTNLEEFAKGDGSIVFEATCLSHYDRHVNVVIESAKTRETKGIWTRWKLKPTMFSSDLHFASKHALARLSQFCDFDSYRLEQRGPIEKKVIEMTHYEQTA